MAGKRKYELQRRVERQEETRRRIAAATAALHEEVGPARTTISAIAARAGVERLTVYRHFPEERELLRACQQHYLAAHPPPDPAPWAAIADPAERLRTALRALYAYYQATEAMTANVLRDLPAMPALAEVVADLPRFYAAIRALLAAGWDMPEDRHALVLGALGHALDFETWRSLVRRQGLTDEQAVEVMVRLVRCLAEGERDGPHAPPGA
jgi:AcrR family transcriptional regulator